MQIMRVWCHLYTSCDRSSRANHIFLLTWRSGSEAVPRYNLMCFDDKRKPMATNHWWVPAVLGPNAAGKNYVTTLPYVVNCEKNGLEVAYPWIMSQKKIVQVQFASPSPSP